MTKLRTINVLSAVLFASGLFLTIYGIFHSFDWTDEAWAYSLIASGRVSAGEPWAFHYLLHPLFLLSGESIVVFRIIRLFSFVLLALWASAVSTKILKLHSYKLSKDAKLLIFLSAQIGTLLIWSWPPRGFAYNELSSLFFQVLVVLISLAYVNSRQLREKPQHKKFVIRNYGLFLVSGFVIGLLFYAKFVTFFMALIVFVISPYGVLVTRKFLSLLTGLLGLIVGLLLPYFFGTPTFLYWQSVLSNIFDEETRAGIGHSESLIEMYFSNISQIALEYLPITFTVAVALVWLDRAGRKKLLPWWAGNIIPSILLTCVILYVTVLVLLSGFGPSGTGALALSLVSSSLGILLSLAFQPRSEISHWRGAKGRKSIFFLSSLVVLVPFLTALGTNNPLMDHLGFESTIWCVLFGVTLAIHLDSLNSAKSHFALVPGLVLLLAMGLALYLSIMHARNPYRSASFKVTNSVVENIPIFAGVHVTVEESKWLNWLRTTAIDLDASDSPAISLNSPAALLAFNNSDFASPWLTSFAPASYESLEKYCADAPPKDLYVLQPHTEMNLNSLRLFESSLLKYCNLNFPSDFQLVRSFDSDDTRFGIAVWKQK